MVRAKKKVIKKAVKKKAPPKEKRPVGRPRNPHARTPETLYKAFSKYMTECYEKSFSNHYDDKNKSQLESDFKYCPGLGKFCRSIGWAGVDSLEEFERTHKEFLPITTRMRHEIKEFIMAAGLYQKVDGRFAQFILNCGFNMVPTSSTNIKAKVVTAGVEIPTSEELSALSAAEKAKILSDALLGKG